MGPAPAPERLPSWERREEWARPGVRQAAGKPAAMNSHPLAPRGSEPATPSRRNTGALAAFALAWLALVAVPPLVLLQARAGWLEQLNRPESQAGWDEFRAAMRRQTGGTGPVQRKVPKSAEPPLRVWLRDYVGLAVAAWVILAGTLGFVTGALVLGATARGSAPGCGPTAAGGSRGRGLLPEDEPCRGGDGQEEQERDAENAEG